MATEAIIPREDPQMLLDVCIEAYENYEDDATMNKTRLGLPQAACLALLEHYFPKNEGYAVQPSRLGPMTHYILSFMLKDADGKSPDYKPLKNPNKNLKLALERELQYAMEEKNWQKISLKNITDFEVSKKVTDGASDGLLYRPHTFLAIMIDNPKTFPLVAQTNDASPWNVLSEAICNTRQIRTGYGVLLYGMHLGIYDYDDGGYRLILEDGEGTNIPEESTAKLAQ